jgi:hypothetical protein
VDLEQETHWTLYKKFKSHYADFEIDTRQMHVSSASLPSSKTWNYECMVVASKTSNLPIKPKFRVYVAISLSPALII